MEQPGFWPACAAGVKPVNIRKTHMATYSVFSEQFLKTRDKTSSGANLYEVSMVEEARIEANTTRAALALAKADGHRAPIVQLRGQA